MRRKVLWGWGASVPAQPPTLSISSHKFHSRMKGRAQRTLLSWIPPTKSTAPHPTPRNYKSNEDLTRLYKQYWKIPPTSSNVLMSWASVKLTVFHPSNSHETSTDGIWVGNCWLNQQHWCGVCCCFETIIQLQYFSFPFFPPNPSIYLSLLSSNSRLFSLIFIACIYV